MNQLKELFLLGNGTTYLNFGSFGACPKPVFQKYQELQLELETDPVYFIVEKGLQYLEKSREALGEYVGCYKDDLVFITNPSFAVNMIAKNFRLQPEDEVLTTNIEYGACDRVWQYYCEKAGAKYIRRKIDLPIESKESFIENFVKGITEKTKLVYLSHITSSTALVFPVEEICAIAKQRGIATFVDGAHAPGQVPLDLEKSSFDYYTGACHKWMMTPKGSSFIYVKKALQNELDPMLISWGYKPMFPSHSQFLDYHQTTGTRDYTAFLTIPAAIEFMRENNWNAVAAASRELVKQNALPLCDILGSKPISPINDDFIAQMFSAPIKTPDPEKLKLHLYQNYKIQIPVMRQEDDVYLRYSINGFNEQSDLDKLFAAVKEIKNLTNLIQ